MKTIVEAIARLNDEWPRARNVIGIHQVASGGLITRPDQMPPLLCATPELAIRTWYDTMRQILHNTRATGFYVVRQPTLDRMQVTMTTALGDQRLTADRFSVVAHVGVSWTQKPT